MAASRQSETRKHGHHSNHNESESWFPQAVLTRRLWEKQTPCCTQYAAGAEKALQAEALHHSSNVQAAFVLLGEYKNALSEHEKMMCVTTDHIFSTLTNRPIPAARSPERGVGSTCG